MKKRIKYLIAGLILLSSAFYFFKAPVKENLNQRAPTLPTLQPQSKEVIPRPDQAPVSDNTTYCQQIKLRYIDLSDIQNKQLRFQNTHKKIGNQIFRLRSYFKEGSEAEVENFLVYLENADEEAKIIEKTPHKKGPQYLKIESSKGEILYLESGINVEENTFLHFINNKLIGSHGTSDCRF